MKDDAVIMGGSNAAAAAIESNGVVAAVVDLLSERSTVAGLIVGVAEGREDVDEEHSI